jgi:hypothetical protein
MLCILFSSLLVAVEVAYPRAVINLPSYVLHSARIYLVPHERKFYVLSMLPSQETDVSKLVQLNLHL